MKVGGSEHNSIDKIPFYLKGRNVSALLLGHHQVKHRKYLKGKQVVLHITMRVSFQRESRCYNT
jgi:hypothetical protein